MAQPKPGDPTHCLNCSKRLYTARLTLPRKAGDLGFCHYGCWKEWDGKQQAQATA